MTWRKILCPVDFSLPSHEAFDLATTLARSSGGEVTVLHVFARPAGDHDGDESAAFRRRAEDSRRQLASWAREAAASGVHAAVHACSGVPATVICDLARKDSFDAIVVGYSGSSYVARIVFGSVAEAVHRAAPCPVVTVGTGPKGALPA